MSALRDDVLTNEECSLVWVPATTAEDEATALTAAIDHLRAAGYMDDCEEGWESAYTVQGRQWLRDTTPKNTDPVYFYDQPWRACEATDEGAVEFWEVVAP